MSVAEFHEAAIEAQRIAEACVLDRIVATVRPALRALSSKIVSRSYETGGPNGLHPVSQTSYFKEKGLEVVGAYTKGVDTTGNRGSFGGYRIYLLSDGTFAKVTRKGYWSNWQGEADEWESTIQPITSREMMDRESLQSILETIVGAIDEELRGHREDVAKAALARAERLRSLLVLMDGK